MDVRQEKKNSHTSHPFFDERRVQLVAATHNRISSLTHVSSFFLIFLKNNSTKMVG